MHHAASRGNLVTCQRLRILGPYGSHLVNRTARHCKLVVHRIIVAVALFLTGPLARPVRNYGVPS